MRNETWFAYGIMFGCAFFLIAALGGCSSLEAKQAYRQAQIDMVKAQTESREKIALQREQAQAKMWEAAADIVKSNPETADAFAVVMAVRVAEDEGVDTGPMIGLQREQNEALELVKAVSPALITTLGHVGVAAIQADLSKTQSDNAAKIAVADAVTEAAVMDSVTTMAATGLSTPGTVVGGDMYSGTVDQSTDDSINMNLAEGSFVNTGTNQIDSGNTTSGDTITDSYNTDSSDNSDNSVTDQSVDDNSDNSDNSTNPVAP